MATTRVKPATRKEDERLRKELQNADMSKFKKLIRRFMSPRKKKSRVR